MCELDIIFNFEKAYFILDEFLMGGEIQETSKKSAVKAIEDADMLQEVRWEKEIRRGNESLSFLLLRSGSAQGCIVLGQHKMKHTIPGISDNKNISNAKTCIQLYTKYIYCSLRCHKVKIDDLKEISSAILTCVGAVRLLGLCCILCRLGGGWRSPWGKEISSSIPG